jgi:hypothetical protein
VSRSAVRLALFALVATAAGCDKVALLAPTGSTVTLSVSTTSIGANGTAEVIATVIEAAGTPVHNGTEVTFQASVGKIDPQVVRTENGIARTTFLANGASGTARIIAFSGGAAATEVELLVGGAAVTTISIRAEPTSLPVTGGSVEVTATAVDASGNPVAGAPVVFSADAGTINPAQVTTDATGQARTTLTTSRETVVTAAVAGQTAEATVSVFALPTINVSHTPATPVVGMPVTFTITPATTTGGSALRSVTFDPGDGSAPRNLGTGTTTVSHVYTRQDTFTARAVATDVSGQIGEGIDVVHPIRVQPTVNITMTGSGLTRTFTITSNPGTGGPPIESVHVAFSPDGGSYEVAPGQATLPVQFGSAGLKSATATVRDSAGTSVTRQFAFEVTAGGAFGANR